MNVLLVSQCDKRALTETRRILDQFAERRGERTWQTPITMDGLDTLRRLLRKTARKNTAVACHWIRGLDHSELLWVVGDRSRFNEQGAVPTNTTRRNVLRQERENDWHTAEDIRLLAQLAALLHDLGKATVAFQQRLRGERSERNLIRHEWASLRFFQAFVGQSDDADWLSRMADTDASDANAWTNPAYLCRDVCDSLERDAMRPFAQLPPLAAAVGWLVVTHHRVPQPPLDKKFVPKWVEEPLVQVDHAWNQSLSETPDSQSIQAYWELYDALPVVAPTWRKEAARLARKLHALRERRSNNWLGNPYVMHLARLCLMLADHHYSSLPAHSTQRVQGDGGSQLYANTGPDGQLKQALDEHLLGVARGAGLIAHALPGFERELPALAQHKGLRKRSGSPRFAWQDKAADAASGLREAASERGAFIVNMASTGCGKTLANARILYALADPRRGLRAAYALGLRTLTLQTGRAYRVDLNLRDDDLAILVGGSASRALFEHHEVQSEATGSASSQALLDEDSHVIYEGDASSHPLLSRALDDDAIRRLLAAPLLVCTVDHLVPATEGLRAGRQIAPMLRLMSGDLVLDELDDYDLADLPALTRLVHWAGLLGTRVVLSSATLPPALVEGMFQAYQAGRTQHQRNRGAHAAGDALAVDVAVPCLWVDEFGVQQAEGVRPGEFSVQHAQFVGHRVTALAKAVPLRRAELQPLQLPMPTKAQERKEQIAAAFAQALLDACLRLHKDHAQTDPSSGKRVSFGLVRMANIEPLFHTARALIELGAPDDTRIHLCVYHARFPLAQRSSIEQQLDAVFNRRDPKAVWHQPGVRASLDCCTEANQIFIVLASPVCEVGRDWDADWAVAEPSSMRSLIQLAGRVQRHRANSPEQPNLLVFDTNLRKFRQGTEQDGQPAAIFVRPGFEALGKPAKHKFRLLSHHLSKLLRPEEYQTLGATPRIQPQSADKQQPKRRLVDLEHARMVDQMLPRDGALEGADGLNAASAWLYPLSGLNGVLQREQTFRKQTGKTVTLVFLPDDDEEDVLSLHRIDKDTHSRRNHTLYVRDDHRCHRLVLSPGQRIQPWGEHDLLSLLRELAESQSMGLRRAAQTFATVEVRQSDQGWHYHPWLGFSSA